MESGRGLPLGGVLGAINDDMTPGSSRISAYVLRARVLERIQESAVLRFVALLMSADDRWRGPLMLSKYVSQGPIMA